MQSNENLTKKNNREGIINPNMDCEIDRMGREGLTGKKDVNWLSILSWSVSYTDLNQLHN